MSKIKLSHDEYAGDIYKLVKKIRKAVKETGIDLDKTAIIALSRGGLYPAQTVAYGLGIRKVFVINSRLYDGTEKGKEISIEGVFGVDFAAYDNFLVVDDIYDSGQTMESVIAALEEVQEVFNEESIFIPCVVHSHKSKSYLKDTGIICARRFKGNPWIVYPTDYLEDEAKDL